MLLKVLEYIVDESFILQLGQLYFRLVSWQQSDINLLRLPESGFFPVFPDKPTVRDSSPT